MSVSRARRRVPDEEEGFGRRAQSREMAHTRRTLFEEVGRFVIKSMFNHVDLGLVQAVASVDDADEGVHVRPGVHDRRES